MQKHIEFKVGLFIVATILMMTSFLGYIAYKKNVFSKEYTFTFSTRSGEGFQEGMPVVFSGFEIGSVDSLELNEKGIVLIKITIPERHVKWARTDSVFILEKPLFGSPRIVVYTENLDSPILTPEVILEIFQIDSINDAIQKVQPLLKKVDSILENSVKITDNLSRKETLIEMAVGDKESVKAINALLKKSAVISSRLDAILEKADRLTARTDQSLFGEGGLLPLISTILRDVIGKLEKLDRAIDDIPEISNNVAESTSDLDTLRKDIETALDSTNDLLKVIDTLLPGKKEREISLP